MNRRSLVWGIGFGLVAVLGVAGVHRIALADDTATASEAREVSGAHEWIGAALEGIEVRDDQRAAVEQLKSDLRTQTASVRSAHEQIREAVAASVEAGAFDHARIDPLVAAAQTAALAQRPAMEDAANRLHALLDAKQREALVSHMHDQMQARFHHHGFGGGDPLTKIATELGLSDDQVTTLRAKFDAMRDGERAGHGFGEMREHFTRMKALADAFESDTFDAHALGLGEHLATVMPQLANRLMTRVEIALPVLTPAQRAQLAQMIRTRHFEALAHG